MKKTDASPEDLDDAVLDAVQGGIAGSVEPNEGLKRRTDGVHGSASPNSGVGGAPRGPVKA